MYSLNISPSRARLLYCPIHNYKVASVFEFCYCTMPDFLHGSWPVVEVYEAEID